jgi:hypothetical protein
VVAPIENTGHVAASCLYFSVCVGFLVPERFGGFAGKSWWAKHHGNVPYTILLGTKDELCPSLEEKMMYDAAPSTHGKMAYFEGGGHDLFTDKESKWAEWAEMTVGTVLTMVESNEVATLPFHQQGDPNARLSGGAGGAQVGLGGGALKAVPMLR